MGPRRIVEGLPRFEPVRPVRFDSALQVRDGLFAMVQELFGIEIHPVHAEAPLRCAACCTSSCCMLCAVLHVVRCVARCMLCCTLYVVFHVVEIHPIYAEDRRDAS